MSQSVKIQSGSKNSYLCVCTCVCLSVHALAGCICVCIGLEKGLGIQGFTKN